MDHDQGLPQRSVERLLDSAQDALQSQDLPRAAALALRADGQAQASGLPALAARAQIMLFELHFQQADHEAAVRHAVVAQRCARQADKPLLLALAQLALAQVAQPCGELGLALSALEAAWPVVQTQGAAALQHRCQHLMAELHQAQGQTAQALQCCARAQTVARTAGLVAHEAEAASHMAELCLAQGDHAQAQGDAVAAQDAWQRAQQANEQALQLAQRADATQLAIGAVCRRAVLLARRRDDGAARQAFEQAQQAIERLPDAHWLLNLERQALLAEDSARLLLAQGQPSQARAEAERAVALGELSQARANLPQLYLLASELAEATGDPATALSRHRQFHQLHSALAQERSTLAARVLAARLQAERGLAEAEAGQARARWQAQARRDLEEPPVLVHELVPLDELTGLANRQHLEQSLAEAHARARAARTPLSVAVLEVVQLADLRQQHGPAVVDSVVCTLAGLLVAQCRPEDLVARREIDFVLVLSGLNLDRARSVCDRVRAAVQRYPWGRLAPGLSIRLGVGMCDLAAHTDPLAGLVHAELYRHEARHSGFSGLVGRAA